MIWIDHLRTFVIVLVVNMHACVTYSHLGSWYMKADPDPPLAIKQIFALWQGHLQAFFMGLMFFLAGYFAHLSLARRGPADFMRERLRRLGVPTLFFMLALHPLIVAVMNPQGQTLPPAGTYWVHRILSGQFLGESGPMWFAFALLVFSALLALVPSRRREGSTEAAAPFEVKPRHLVAIGLGIALSSFLVRTVQPIGTSILNFQLCFFPQYITAFALGMMIARAGGMETLAALPLARRAGLAALIGGPFLVIAIVSRGGGLPLSPASPLFGGWHVQSLEITLWEQFTALGLSLGLLYLCAKRFNRDVPLLRWMDDRSFGVYLFHPPILVALGMALRPLHAGPFVLAALLTVSGLAVSYGVTDLVRRIPGVNRFL